MREVVNRVRAFHFCYHMFAKSTSTAPPNRDSAVTIFPAIGQLEISVRFSSFSQLLV